MPKLTLKQKWAAGALHADLWNPHNVDPANIGEPIRPALAMVAPGIRPNPHVKTLAKRMAKAEEPLKPPVVFHNQSAEDRVDELYHGK